MCVFQAAGRKLVKYNRFKFLHAVSLYKAFYISLLVCKNYLRSYDYDYALVTTIFLFFFVFVFVFVFVFAHPVRKHVLIL